MTNERIDLDLDTLTGQSRKVKINGNVIEVFPPSVEELFKLQQLASQFKKIDTENITEDQAFDVLENLKSAFISLIPQLKDFKVNVEQLFKLLDLIVEMAVPHDLKELEKRGIKPSTEATDEKKILSDSSEK